jgi:hypothetical protein
MSESSVIVVVFFNLLRRSSEFVCACFALVNETATYFLPVSSDPASHAVSSKGSSRLLRWID